jgi:transcriptional regulator with XRE-family HTH domain
MSMKLSDYLKKFEIKQDDFAKRVGCTQGRIAQLIAGAIPSMQLAQKIASETNNKVPLGEWGCAEKAA